MSGRVAFGRQLGRQLDTPTANVMVNRHQLPLTGVFAVQVTEEESGRRFSGVANCGIKPTVAGVPEPSLEVHLLDFSGNLYHRHLTVEFVHKLREEQKFAGLAELQQAIAADKQAARQYFAARAAAGH
jgi:riboflavin kinase/FMN adenylyltransferase